MHIWEVLMTSQKNRGSCVQPKPCSAIIILPPCTEVLHNVALIWQQLNRVSCCKGPLLPSAFSALSGGHRGVCYASQISLRTQPRGWGDNCFAFLFQAFASLASLRDPSTLFPHKLRVLLTGSCLLREKGSFLGSAPSSSGPWITDFTWLACMGLSTSCKNHQHSTFIHQCDDEEMWFRLGWCRQQG